MSGSIKVWMLSVAAASTLFSSYVAARNARERNEALHELERTRAGLERCMDQVELQQWSVRQAQRALQRCGPVIP